MSTTSTASNLPRADDHFPAWAETIRKRAASLFAAGRIFTTAVEGLFEIYLSALPEELRQAHNCHCCKAFLARYGGLAYIDKDGSHQPIFWGVASDAPREYQRAVLDLAGAISQAKVTGVFLSKEESWGIATTGEWQHFAVPALARYHSALKMPGQAMAEKLEEYGMLRRGLAEFPRELVAKACALLATDTLYRQEKVEGVAKWLLDLHERRDATKNTIIRDNLIWLAVATAPAGFCHVRSTMVGTLLEDLEKGLSADEAARRFKDKMHPLQYQRPTASPSEGNIAQAEKAIGALKSAGALERRFARLSEVKTLWTPRPPAEQKTGGGVFDHLRPGAKKAEPLDVNSAKVITWEKFAREILPGAEFIECYVPSGRAPFAALVTATNPEAPAILKWDFDGARNPVSWYLYMSGSAATTWNLKAGEFVEVKAFTLSPAKWNPDRPTPNEGNAALAILAGAKDLNSDNAGNALFPEILKSDYHGFRKTIEAYSRGAKIAGREEGDANGIMLQAATQPWNVTFRVLSKGVRALYRPDRWD